MYSIQLWVIRGQPTSLRSANRDLTMRSIIVTFKKATFAVVALAWVSLVGCATSGKAPSTAAAAESAEGIPSTAELTSDFSRSKLIAADFVATMAQLPESNPRDMVLHTNKPSSRFGELLLGELQRAGYDLRIGDAQSENWLTYNANLDDSLSEKGNPVYTFLVAAGSVKLKRSYEVDKYGIRPAGNMFVRGASANDVVMDHSIFSVRAAELSYEGNFSVRAAELNSAADGSVPAAELKYKDTFNEVTAVEANGASRQPQALPTSNAAPAATLTSPESSSTTDSLSNAVAELNEWKLNSGLSNSAKQPYSEFSNMYETGESRFEELFQNYEVIERAVYAFPSDTLIFGKHNKMQLLQLAEKFNSQTDVMSVIGCSHGASALENGNAYLANNRAFRVKEEFVLAGLDANKVMEEGCWANVDFDEMPARGVLVEHRRKIN